MFGMIIVQVAKFRIHKVARALKRLLLIAIVAESVLERGRFIIRENFSGFFAKNFSFVLVTTR